MTGPGEPPNDEPPLERSDWAYVEDGEDLEDYDTEFPETESEPEVPPEELPDTDAPDAEDAEGEVRGPDEPDVDDTRR